MEDYPYTMPPGLRPIPAADLDLRSDTDIDHDLAHPPPVRNDKNLWFFWHAGFGAMHTYAQRNVRTWHRRFARRGWVVRVVDRVAGSPLNIANFADVADRAWFPRAFTDETISGDYARQHESDLVRWPLLLRHGGVYADVGLMPVGDLDALWNATVGDPLSKFDVVSFNAGGVEGRSLTNYFLCAGRNNHFFERCHRLLLALWAAGGGKNSTHGMHESPLLEGSDLMGKTFAFEDEEINRRLTDYIIQGQVMTMVMGLIDEEDGWNGPEYVAEHVYAMDFMVGSQLINEFTAWNGPRAFELMSLPLPKKGEEVETEDQKKSEGNCRIVLAKVVCFQAGPRAHSQGLW